MQSSKLAAALEAAANGFRVFPVIPNTKHPAIDDWPDKATISVDRIQRWWDANPDYNIGVATGRGVTVIDADCKKDRPGLDSLAMLDMLGLPESFRATTPSGGLHVYLRTTKAFGNRADTIAEYPGIDIRGERGYVLAPGSTLDGIAYKAISYATPCAAPDWLEAALDRRTTHAPRADQPLIELDLPENIAKAIDWLQDHAPEAVEGAGGDTVTYSVAAELRALGIAEATALDLLLEHWNEAKASPPWQPDELAVKVKNAFSHGQGAPGYKTAAGEFGALDIDVGEPPAAKEHTEASPPSPFPWINIATWDGVPVPEREWAIPDCVPLRQVGVFSGEGGLGKSLLELQKNVAHVIGGEWLGMRPVQGGAFYLGCEDEEAEIHKRLADIAEHYGTTFGALAANGLRARSLIGVDATLCAVSPKTGKVEVTPLYKRLYEEAGDLKPRNISVDTLSRVFAGNEIDRVQVYAFAMHMQALAKVANASVTVLSHPSLSGIASGSGLSGSTAWHGAFRFRQYLTSPKTEAGEPPATEFRELQFKKNQYGPPQASVVLSYQRGLFLPAPGHSFDAAEREADASDVFLELLRRFRAQDRSVCERPGPTYAPAVFAKEELAQEKWVGKKDLEIVMRQLFTAGKIRVEVFGPPSKQRSRIALANGN